ncbi:unnamed protein product [Penicillium pancosmium]
MAGTNDVFVFKLVLIGDSGVGKSCCLLRFAEPWTDSFDPSFIPTVGIDFKMRIIQMDGRRVSLQIWDTAGQESFRSIIAQYYRGAMGIFLVYDVTNERSFHNIRNWASTLEPHVPGDSKKILIGSKCDCAEKRVISSEQGQQLADELGIPFFEVSAKDNVNIDEAFYKLVSDIKASMEILQNEQTGTMAVGEIHQSPPLVLDLGDNGRCC